MRVVALLLASVVLVSLPSRIGAKVVSELHTKGGVITQIEDEQEVQPQTAPNSRRRLQAQTLTGAQKQLILDTHNNYRSDTAQGKTPGEPGAQNMYKLMWDEALANVARNYANGCYWLHNPNRNSEYAAQGGRRSTGTSAGENLAVSYGGANFPADVNVWLLNRMSGLFNEYPDYNFNSDTCASGKMCGHYTQIVWDNTLYVGCGYAFCSSMVNGYNTAQTFTNAAYLVCNYAPPGNYPRQPYTSGSACGACPSGSSCNGLGLCDTGGATGLGPIPAPTPKPTKNPITSGGGGVQKTSGDGSCNSGLTGTMGFYFPNSNANCADYTTALIDFQPCVGSVVSCTDSPYPGFSTYRRVSMKWQLNRAKWDLGFDAWRLGIQGKLQANGITFTGASTTGGAQPTGTQSLDGGSSSNGKTTDPTPTIVGAVIGSLAGVCLLGACVWYGMKRRNDKSSEYMMMQENRQADYNPPTHG